MKSGQNERSNEQKEKRHANLPAFGGILPFSRCIPNIPHGIHKIMLLQNCQTSHISCHQIDSFGSKCTEICGWLGLQPGLWWGSLQCSPPDPLVCWGGDNLNRLLSPLGTFSASNWAHFRRLWSLSFTLKSWHVWEKFTSTLGRILWNMQPTRAYVPTHIQTHHFSSQPRHICSPNLLTVHWGQQLLRFRSTKWKRLNFANDGLAMLATSDIAVVVRIIGWIGLSSVSRPRQHSIGYIGDGFYRSKDPTNSIKVLKEHTVHREIKHTISRHINTKHSKSPSLH